MPLTTTPAPASSGAPTPSRTPALTATPRPTPTPTPAATSSPSALGPAEGAVTVLTFRGYAEYGGSDPRANWVVPFERETGCRVNLRFPQTPGDMDKAVDQIRHDVVSAPPEVAGRLIAEGKVVPINTALVPHYDDLAERLRTRRSVAAGGRVYGVPYLWGSYVTLYDATGKRAMKGRDLFTDAGPAMFRDSPLTIADAALALARQRPALGIDDPFQLTRAQLDAVMSFLAGPDDGERLYWKEPIEALQALAGGTARIGRALPYHLDMLRRADRAVKAVPDEATTGFVDAWMVSARATAPNCAYRWLDYMSSKSAQREAAAWTGLAPANPDACERRTARVCSAYRLDDDAWLKKIEFAVRPGVDCPRGERCTDYAEWTARWRALVD
ncbi:extracellular solute-binding protein [Sphaerisporangium sp. TRM90804]|uniref:extracellular solute-binding protein n=1 Tax=Sphaerisporangium sp. TRM90804 TaxID=3031113 RepID=UPI00244801DF|nr:extracellular solute-binding protein [Sphaerisporangium sp. TRM90804]MDH2425256.1 extracellular solute-binding protein [Sphaerisporangium sp. TRM90804]